MGEGGERGKEERRGKCRALGTKSRRVLSHVQQRKTLADADHPFGFVVTLGEDQRSVIALERESLVARLPDRLGLPHDGVALRGNCAPGGGMCGPGKKQRPLSRQSACPRNEQEDRLHLALVRAAVAMLLGQEEEGGRMGLECGGGGTPEPSSRAAAAASRYKLAASDAFPWCIEPAAFAMMADDGCPPFPLILSLPIE